ncbi:MAG: curli production assembly/transport component CsgG, partial [Hymenobacter sp.]|nr:curli production assembly/transport component CsgG [Hymenobacter sp.]
LFRFVDFKRLLETETGFTYNEPSEMAVKDAIEKSVQALIYEGFADRLWVPLDSTEYNGPGIQNYINEKNANLGIDVLGREERLRRTSLAVGLNAAVQQYNGDYAAPVRRPGAEFTIHYHANAAASVFLNLGRGQLTAGATGSSFNFNHTFNYAEAGLHYRILPFDQFTPYVIVGGGATSREPLRSTSASALLPHLIFGVGAEYLLTPRLGISASFDNHFFLTDQLDQVSAGRYNDSYWGGRVGAVIYLGKTIEAKAIAKAQKTAAQQAAGQVK